MTMAAKGDQALALFLTVASNMLGIVTVPYLLKMYFENNSTITISPVLLITNLLITVMFPSILGVLLRKYVVWVPKYTNEYKYNLSVFSAVCLALIVWISIIH
jgi:sodium/bile acid cotransporter 7